MASGGMLPFVDGPKSRRRPRDADDECVVDTTCALSIDDQNAVSDMEAVADIKDSEARAKGFGRIGGTVRHSTRGRWVKDAPRS